MEKRLFTDVTTVYENVDDFINGVIRVGMFISHGFAEMFEGAKMMVTRELSEQLADTEENKPIWDRIYSEVPEEFLMDTLRVIPEDGQPFILVIGRYGDGEHSK